MDVIPNIDDYNTETDLVLNLAAFFDENPNTGMDTITGLPQPETSIKKLGRIFPKHDKKEQTLWLHQAWINLPLVTLNLQCNVY